MKRRKPIPVIIGPTAVGKTTFCIDFALSVGAEIISCDSKQVYIGMNVGTAKPTYSIQEIVPHHLIDIVYPDEEFNAQIWSDLARDSTETILKQGHVPVIVCGTGLYLSAYLNGFFSLPNMTLEKRKEIRLQIEELKKRTSPFDFLKKIDFESSKQIHPNDKYRIERAIEIYFLTGKSRSFHKNQKELSNKQKVFYIGLNMYRSKLHNRINTRVDDMFKNGFLEEVEHLISLGYEEDLNAFRAPGYRELIKYLKGGISIEETKCNIKTKTRNYAKRQLTWFKKIDRINWFDISSGRRNVLRRVVDLYRNM